MTGHAIPTSKCGPLWLGPSLAFEPPVHFLPQPLVHNGRLFSRVDRALVADLSDVGYILQDGEKTLFAKWLAGVAPAGVTGPVLGSPPAPVQFLHYRNEAFMLGIEG